MREADSQGSWKSGSAGQEEPPEPAERRMALRLTRHRTRSSEPDAWPLHHAQENPC